MHGDGGFDYGRNIVPISDRAPHASNDTLLSIGSSIRKRSDRIDPTACKNYTCSFAAFSAGIFSWLFGEEGLGGVLPDLLVVDIGL